MQGRSKKLSDLINEARVPLAERAGVPVVRSSPGRDRVGRGSSCGRALQVHPY
ncbi:MAG: tRNA lysidine(34) synthetase TilS [Collinsella sp.]